MSEKIVGLQAAEVVLPAPQLDATATFFVERLGFVIDLVYPADDPAVVVLRGFGLRIRLERDVRTDLGREPGLLRLSCDGPVDITPIIAPNGTVIELVPVELPIQMPPLAQSFVVTPFSDDLALWGTGRAGMLYRDLLPEREGGRFIVSHIRIPQGGPVPDYVHYHEVRFQMIFCYKGWVRVVYEDQGPAFVMYPGDCVLQPPGIRHQVLECSDGLEVVEVGCPAEHLTHVDHGLQLPTADVKSERQFGGQRFVRHIAAQARWAPWRAPGFIARDVGIDAATSGLAQVSVLSLDAVDIALSGPGLAESANLQHDGELFFLFVLRGGVDLTSAGLETERIGAGGACAIPAHVPFTLNNCSRDLELLHIALP